MGLKEFLLDTPVGTVITSFVIGCVVLLGGWIVIEGVLTGLHNRKEAKEAENANR
jgi:hypothetical protein